MANRCDGTFRNQNILGNQMDNSIYSKGIRRKVLSLPSYNGLNSTLTSVMSARLRTLAIFAHGRVSRQRRKRLRFEDLKALRSSLPNGAMVIAAGPSAIDVTKNGIQWMRLNGRSIWALNGVATHDWSKEFPPEYIVLADPLHFPRAPQSSAKLPPEVMRDLRYLETFTGTLFVPHAKLEYLTETPASVIPFNFEGLEGLTSNIDPTRPRGYSGLTAYAALALALYVCNGDILLSGYDSSWSRFLQVDDLNRVVIGSHHSYDDDSTIWEPMVGIGDALANCARCLKDLEMFPGDRVVNLGGRSSMVDHFPRASVWVPPWPST